MNLSPPPNRSLVGASSGARAEPYAIENVDVWRQRSSMLGQVIEDDKLDWAEWR